MAETFASVARSLHNCKAKVRHTTQSKAIVAAARVASKRRVKSLHVYRCPHCAGWHLTHQERDRRG